MAGTGGAGFYVGPSGGLTAEGTSADRVVFTSAGDDSVGGDTNGDGPSTGSPGDYGEAVDVSGSGTLDVENDTFDYASEAVLSTSDSDVTIKSNHFTNNETAIDIAASYDVSSLSGTNAVVEDNWFDGNTVSINATSDWSPVDPLCQYVPWIAADGNLYGESSSSSPLVTTSELASIEAATLLSGDNEYPDGWVDDVKLGDTDSVEGWLDLPCVLPDPADPTGPPLAECTVTAIPLYFEVGDPSPAACDIEEESVVETSAQSSSASGVPPDIVRNTWLDQPQVKLDVLWSRPAPMTAR